MSEFLALHGKLFDFGCCTVTKCESVLMIVCLCQRMSLARQTLAAKWEKL